MKERPILFSAPMVRAVLEGSKTQTRRPIRPQPNSEPTAFRGSLNQMGTQPVMAASWADGFAICPYGVPGDRLWIREAFSRDCDPHWTLYRADGVAQRRSGGELFDQAPAAELNPAPKWKPSIHMPRSASRITLEVVAVRVERLQDTSEADARAEGSFSFAGEQETPLRQLDEARLVYRELWQSINGPGSWDANPWVWVVEFRRLP